MAENNFKGTVEALFHGMDAVVSSKTVVGDADKKEKGAGGIGGKMTPSAVLVIQNGHTKLVNIKNQDTITKLLDMVPDVMDRFTSRKEDNVTEDDVNKILDEAEK